MRVDDVNQDVSRTDKSNHSYAEILKEIGTSTRDLVQSEVSLITTELKDSAQKAGRHMAQAAAFGALLAISVFPLLAFVVIGLGNLLGGRYWLSSLLVGLVCAIVGGVMAYRAYKKIKEEDLKFEHTRNSLKFESDAIRNKIEDVKDAVKGEHYGPNELH